MFRSLLYKGFGILATAEADKLELASRNPEQCQSEKLLSLLATNQETIYGREHNFSAIKSISDYQDNVPINEYETLQPYINRIAGGEQNVLTAEMPFMFATTSGTSGARKLIPITRAYVKEFRAASVSSGFHLLQNFPGVAKGVSLSVFSPAEEGRTEGDIPYGAISGRLYLEEPPLIKKFISPLPYEIFLISDYESRYYTLLRCALLLPVSTIYTLNPSTIMVLARRLHTFAPQLIDDVEHGTLNPPSPLPPHITKALRNFLVPQPGKAKKLRKLLAAGQFTAKDVWPNLSLICCWTRAAAAFYLQDFPAFFPHVPVCDITYGASEGRGTVSISPHDQMLAIRSHFFEFMPLDHPTGRPLLAHELTAGASYYILFTTASGLYRYNINDIVKVVGWHNQTPLLEFQHKGGNISSFTGEKLTESQVTQSVQSAAADCALRIRFFTVIPQFRPEPHYQLWFEPEHKPEQERGCTTAQVTELNSHFDRHLRLNNIEYEAKRDSNRLADTTVHVLRSGAYEELRIHLVSNGVPDAQVKVSHLNPKEEIRDFLQERLLAGALR